MQRKVLAILLLLSLALGAYAQKKAQKPDEDKPIRISTELVQVDAVVTDKNGQIVRDLTKDDFDIYESGKKQVVSFFEFVDASRKKAGEATPVESPPAGGAEDVSETDVRRIFAFVIDDLTIRNEDLFYVREMLTKYVNEQMASDDLVAIVRTVGGRGLLQQFTTNKQLLLRAISLLTPSSHPIGANNPPLSGDVSGRDTRPVGASPTPIADTGSEGGFAIDTSVNDLFNPLDDTVQLSRAIMTLGTAGFVIDSMGQLPGRKSLILVSGGLLLTSPQTSTSGTDIGNLLFKLTDKATRSGVAVHTMDIRGLSANAGVASFTDTPAKSAIPTDLASLSGSSINPRTDPLARPFGKGPDEKMLGRNTLQDQLGLRALASATGGIAVMNKNNFADGLSHIVEISQGYYVLAYTPLDTNFDGKFRKVEIKLKRGGLKVYSRKGYLAKEEPKLESAVTKEHQLLAAIRSPLARRDIRVQAMVNYKATQPRQGAIDIHLLVDPKTLKLDETDGKHQTSFDVAGFVFDEFGEMRGGFSETINASLTPEEFRRVSQGGLTYSANTSLPSGIYQIRIAVRDNKTGRTGTVSRYLEVPDLTKGRFWASSLMISAARPEDTGTNETLAMLADRQISRTRDLRFAVAIYNAKIKDGKSQVRAQMSISQDGRIIYTDTDETVKAASEGQLLKIGQLGLSRVKPGRYTLTVVITDPLTDKKYQTITRTTDFLVLD